MGSVGRGAGRGGCSVGRGVGLLVGEYVGEGVRKGSAGRGAGRGGCSVGRGVSVGAGVLRGSVGDLVGTSVGDAVGVTGLAVGDTVGDTVGRRVGALVGLTVGLAVGDVLGLLVGLLVGRGQAPHASHALGQQSPLIVHCPSQKQPEASLVPQVRSVHSSCDTGALVGLLVGEYVGEGVVTMSVGTRVGDLVGTRGWASEVIGGGQRSITQRAAKAKNSRVWCPRSAPCRTCAVPSLHARDCFSAVELSVYLKAYLGGRLGRGPLLVLVHVVDRRGGIGLCARRGDREGSHAGGGGGAERRQRAPQ